MLNEHWEDARKAINDKIPEMSFRAAEGIGPHIPRLIQANNSKDLKYVISLPSAPGNYDTSSKKTIPLGKNLIVEVTTTGGSLFGLSFQIGKNSSQRVPVLRLDYWDVRATTSKKINLHYHVPSNRNDHNPIRTAPGVQVNE